MTPFTWLTWYLWQSSIETVTAPPFYKQIAGTVILCDVSISVTSSYSDVRDLDLSCKTLYDESLPPATPEQLGELSESLEFFTKIGKWLQERERERAEFFIFNIPEHSIRNKSEIIEEKRSLLPQDFHYGTILSRKTAKCLGILLDIDQLRLLLLILN